MKLLIKPKTGPSPEDVDEFVKRTLSANFGINEGDSPGQIKTKLVAIEEMGGTQLWLDRFLTQDSRMEDIKSAIQDLAMNQEFKDDPVLITGPSGTGKELLAKALHGNRGQLTSNGPDMRGFVAVNCAAISETLIESELFGHKRGSFTGAVEDRKGLLRAVQHGTILLDEIGDLPLGSQAKLLRAVQEREARPVGDTESYPITSRIVCCTKHDLLSMIARREFREDLYGRLMTFELQTTGLLDRPDDIPLILRSLKCPEDKLAIPQEFLDTYVRQFNCRALQAYVKRMKAWRSLGV